MSRKPETVYIASVHKHLKTVYKEKMNNPFRSGTPDVWYSGSKGDLWIEYKYEPTVPKTREISPRLSPAQAMWLDCRCAEGRNVAVVVGTPKGGVIFVDYAWNYPTTPSEFTANLLPASEIAAWIHKQTGDARVWGTPGTTRQVMGYERLFEQQD